MKRVRNTLRNYLHKYLLKYCSPDLLIYWNYVYKVGMYRLAVLPPSCLQTQRMQIDIQSGHFLPDF